MPLRRPAVFSRTGRAVGRAIGGGGAFYRALITRFALLFVLLWIAAAALLPRLITTGPTSSGALSSILPAHSKAVALEKRSLAQFAIPVLSETAVVVHDPGGLSLFTRADVVAWALSFAQASARETGTPPPGRIVAAIPIPTRSPTTAVTYLYTSSGTSNGDTLGLAQQYAAHFRADAGVRTAVTGLLPAQLAQGNYLSSRLDLFAAASVVLVAVVVALTFRALLAPVVVLGVFGIGYLATQPLLRLLAGLLNFPLPPQLEPLTVGLLLGVVTDYSMLLFSDLRDQVERGADHGDAVRRTLQREAAVVTVAGLTVAGGTISLLAANLELFRAFGPALALTVLMGLFVSLTLTPALMTLLGRRLFRLFGPAGQHRNRRRVNSTRAVGGLLRAVTHRASALVVLLIGVGALLAAASPALHMRLSVSFTAVLPSTDPAQRAARWLEEAGIRGVTGPTEVLIESKGIARQRTELSALQRAVGSQPGVVQVLGPAQNPLPDRFGVVLSRDGDAARLVVLFDSDPLGARAIAQLRALQPRLPPFARSAGLSRAQVNVTGETAIASELTELTRVNLKLILLVALGVEFVLLAIYLRALVAPVVLLACSALGVAAALGLTVAVFQGLRGDSGLTFYAPFATAVLLLALGSDYNVFAVGTIWEEARQRPLREALRVAVPRSSRAITAAGFVLASTLGLVAIIPLETFRELAFTMAAGLLLDTLVVRPVLTPAVLTVLGRAAGWPGHRIRTDQAPSTAQEDR